MLLEIVEAHEARRWLKGLNKSTGRAGMSPDSTCCGEGAVIGRSPEVSSASDIIVSSADSSSAGIGGDPGVEGLDSETGASSGAAGAGPVPGVTVVP
jgi:hypothetical protein